MFIDWLTCIPAVFVYDKIDNTETQTATLNFVSCSFVHKERTADYTATYRLREMVKDGANKADIVAYLQNKNIPVDDITIDKSVLLSELNYINSTYCFNLTLDFWCDFINEMIPIEIRQMELFTLTTKTLFCHS